MAYVAIDAPGARNLGQALRDTATRVDTVRREVSVALNMADLDSQVPIQLSVIQDGFTSLSMGVLDKADLAERFTVDPQGTSARLGAPVEAIRAAITGLLGFAGPVGLRGTLLGLPAAGTDPALDAALARLDPVLQPALHGGERPELTEAQIEDLRLLALQLGIEHAGPPTLVEADANGRFLAGAIRRSSTTEVFWNDFWADGRSVEQVLADPVKLFDWVAGTYELDRRLSVAPELPGLPRTRSWPADPTRFAACVPGNARSRCGRFGQPADPGGRGEWLAGLELSKP
jgi:hypothetical protein